MNPVGITVTHALLALAVVTIWGSNFVVIRVGLDHLPALFLAGLRFSLVFLPAALFLKPPQVQLAKLAGYGLFIGAGQFGLLFTAMNGHISPGITSLVIQTQVFFAIGLAMLVNRERMAPVQWLSLALGAAGLVVILIKGGGSASPLGVTLVLLGALSWAVGNLVGRMEPGINMLAFVVWSSPFAAVPLLALSLLTEGWRSILDGLQSASLGTWASLGWQVIGNSLFGYTAWAWLMTRYPTTTVAPFALLVPIFGMASAAIFLHEALPVWKFAAAVLVLAGLALSVLWPRFRGGSPI